MRVASTVVGLEGGESSPARAEDQARILAGPGVARHYGSALWFAGRLLVPSPVVVACCVSRFAVSVLAHSVWAMVDGMLPGPVRWVCPGEPNGVEEATFGRALREMRQSAGLSQRELAERLGTTQSAVARMENGATQPKLRTIEKLAEALKRDLYLHVRGEQA